ncbi:hypothetical protein FB446DRAFT_655244 [Lentinula raphanica]|nr:hypothetical protein FB446DRAFT_655244 [Lentinula raphanica]
MYSIHSFAHRAPASRAGVRWQPYGNPPPSGSTFVSTSSSCRSPLSKSSSSFSALTSPISTPPRDAAPLKQEPPQSTTLQPPRDTRFRNKNRYASSLVDQAVKSLCDIWHPQNIPQVFLITSCTAIPVPAASTKGNCQHPSQSAHNQHPVLFAIGIHPECDSHPGVSNLLPMKGFVHEVLRRSRTSGRVLQIALCYLEAVRPRIPEIAQSDNLIKVQTELADQITVTTEDGLARESEFCIGTDTILSNKSNDTMDNIRVIRVSDSESYSGSTAVFSGTTEDDESTSTLKKSKAPSPSLSPLPSLPSPLLCPRRAFLASLILASKFMQDECYSNRAWAELSGLPPREVGRCERALGDALDWRLWVGKFSSQSQTSRTAAEKDATFGQCRAHSSGASLLVSTPKNARHVQTKSELLKMEG